MAAKPDTDFNLLVRWGAQVALGSSTTPASEEQVAEVVTRLTAAAERGDVAATLWLQKMAATAGRFVAEQYLVKAGFTLKPDGTVLDEHDEPVFRDDE